jgi:hypothetical protein
MGTEELALTATAVDNRPLLHILLYKYQQGEDADRPSDNALGARDPSTAAKYSNHGTHTPTG